MEALVQVMEPLGEDLSIFVSPSETGADRCRQALKLLYDTHSRLAPDSLTPGHHKQDDGHKKALEALVNISQEVFPLGPVQQLRVTNDVDVEQIWAYLEVRNGGMLPILSKLTSKFKKERLSKPMREVKASFFPPSDIPEVEKSDGGGDIGEGQGLRPSVQGVAIREDDEVQEGLAEEAQGRGADSTHSEEEKKKEDPFFNLDEMDNFIAGAEELAGRGELFDPDDAIDSVMSEDEDDNAVYSDFFGSSLKKRQVRFDHEQDINGERDTSVEEEQEDVDDEEDPEKVIQMIGENGAIDEAEPTKRKKRILELEQQRMEEKPWHLTGEVRASDRPLNSLLEADLVHKRADKPRPLTSLESTMDLEQMVQQRIVDEAFDDVERKEKLGNRDRIAPAEISQMMSTEGLGQVYEREYLSKVEKELGRPESTDESPEHKEINRLFRLVTEKLDLLCNVHSRRKDITLKKSEEAPKSIASIAAGDEAALSRGDETFFAPKEVLDPTKPIGEGEKTKDERARLRRAMKRRRPKITSGPVSKVPEREVTERTDTIDLSRSTKFFEKLSSMDGAKRPIETGPKRTAKRLKL